MFLVSCTHSEPKSRIPFRNCWGKQIPDLNSTWFVEHRKMHSSFFSVCRKLGKFRGHLFIYCPYPALKLWDVLIFDSCRLLSPKDFKRDFKRIVTIQLEVVNIWILTWAGLAWPGAKCIKTLLAIENFFTLHRSCTVTVHYWCSISKAKHDQIF